MRLIARHCKSAPIADVVSCLFENKYFRSSVFAVTVMSMRIVFLAVFYIATLTRNTTGTQTLNAIRDISLMTIALRSTMYGNASKIALNTTCGK